MRGRVEFHILGPLRVVVDGAEVPIAARRQRALLVLLALNAGRVVTADRLIDQLWDGAPPPQAPVTLRSYVSNVRQALGGPTGSGSVLVTRGQGYCLDIDSDDVDSVRLAVSARAGREHLRRDRPDQALEAFDAALSAWTADPLTDIADHKVARSSITQLTETYLGAVEGRFEALLALGRHADALPDLEAFAADHPLREEPRVMLMLALYRAGRAAEALEAYRTYRIDLRDELGIDPSPRLDDLHQRILQGDPALAAPVLSRERTGSASLDADGVAIVPPPTAQTPQGSDAKGSSDASTDSTDSTDSAGSAGSAGSADATTSEATASAPRALPPGTRPAVVGRQREQAVLDARLEALEAGHGGALLLLAGEPGIGKTTLLEVLARNARGRGIRVHTGRSPAPSGAPPFWPWSQIVDSIAAGLDDAELTQACDGAGRPVAQLSPAVAARVGSGIPMTGDSPTTLRFLLYEAVASFIRQAAAGRPTVIILDDLHWADLSSLELLSYVTPGLATQPALVASAYRDLPTERSDALNATLATVSREDVVHELHLSGLARQDIAALANDLFDQSSAPHRDELIAVLHRRTGGNPFFLRQLIRLFQETEPVTTDPGALPIPPGVRHVVASRLASLPAPVEEFLASAAVLGREFDVRTAAAVAGITPAEALDAFDEVARHGLVEVAPDDGGTRQFVHALVQEAVLHKLPGGRRSMLHAAAGRLLERDGSATPDERARHMWAARDVVGAEAVPSQLAAADAAASVFAHQQAETHLRHALDLARSSSPPDPALELAILLRLFRLIAVDRGWGDQAAADVVDHAMKLNRAGGYDDDLAPMWWLLFNFLLDRNLVDSYVELARTLLTQIEDEGGDVSSVSQAAVQLMNVFASLATDERAKAAEHLTRARAHVESARDGGTSLAEEQIHVSMLLTTAFCSALSGDVEAHLTSIAAAIALGDADGRPFSRALARSMGAVSASYVGDAVLAESLASQALELDRRFGFGWLATVAGSVHHWAAASQGGDPDDAAVAIEATLDEMVAAGRKGTQSTILLMLADVHRMAGRIDEARSCLLRARAAPGPYHGLLVDLANRRQQALS